MRAKIAWAAGLNLWSNCYSYATILVPSVLTAPRYFAGEIEFGVITQAGAQTPPSSPVVEQCPVSGSMVAAYLAGLDAALQQGLEAWALTQCQLHELELVTGWHTISYWCLCSCCIFQL